LEVFLQPVVSKDPDKRNVIRIMDRFFAGTAVPLRSKSGTVA
jgi:hypothetical protein